ncbi:1-acyl-sn-glycerol-3-phosphate acyltransferase delta-like isoform X2 [Corticium candelabrum]|uniref:1-acyl-sn-glycerol-3-phosphate acyltransferase delta-like isoform X2 n=1 Tax=Corticium candelabrum TaxID=121492 RepID=UPI002E265821|nr:1-acyl-sn-glycerol-3-phosphate acyltransferase delta-like isoform X2 [Corticium candelabrum]
MLFGVISVIFLGAGLTVNFLELLAFILIRPFSLSLFRRVNAFLCYLFWSIFTWVLDYWGSQEMRIFSDEDLSYEELSRFNKVAILNHRGDIDWMLGIALCDRLGILQSVKCVTKDFAKYLPTMGWNFWFSEFAFLKRKFEADHSRLAEAARCWNSYDFPWTLCFYPEGTRFTEEKHQKSCEYARKKGLPELKHHLLPRTKGFNILIREFKDHVPYVYDITFGYPHGIVTLMNLAQGQKVYADVYLRRIPVSEIPMGSEEETSKWLIDLFKEKDRMVDYHSIHGQFPFPLWSNNCWSLLEVDNGRSNLSNSFFWTASYLHDC